MPSANLLVARSLAAHPEFRSSTEAKTAPDAVLGLRPKKKEQKPFLFAMGTDFLKLKHPLMWFNILHVLTALSPIEGVRDNPGFRELLALLGNKRDAEGKIKAESTYMIHKTRERNDKKRPSRPLTTRTHEVLNAFSAG